MKKNIITLLTFILTISSWAQVESYDLGEETNVASSSNGFGTSNEWLLGVRNRLDVMMDDNLLKTSQLGMLVYDLTTEEVVFQKNERQRMRPASVMKLVTSITALDMLGGNYDYRTSICYSGTLAGDTLRGYLFCVGGFDPMMTRQDVAAMADTIRRFGISRIEGMIVADLSMKDTLSYGNGWCWDDDNDRLTPLLVDKKDRFLYAMSEELRSHGVELDITFARGKVPQGCTEIYMLRRNINQILQRMMKESDNLYAESMFYQIAANSSTNPGRASDASGAMKRLVYKLGLDPTMYTFADGSGLSLYNYVSAELIVKLLRYAYQYPEIYSCLYPTLPIAGVDGTLENRMKKGKATGNVHAKTGTVNGVSTLAGYCRASNGHLLCFAILNQGVVKASDGREFQNKVCEALCK
ncbi:MAG: D-alanyl-D-alanine carboxypeptidase/D-alanyl-D-alanine-endopeptidase [Bacteroidales bacterium]|nr:D-alanyl-D-alanine carboxypeptidase/D-alanyl-D-alanine-endopeptidase [Bacteroidales bacterium]